MAYYSFDERHNGPDKDQVAAMLHYIGADGLEKLISETIPASIRIKGNLPLKDAMTEQEYLRMLREVSFRNSIFRTYIGLGYYNTVVPGVIQRNILENPGWYTAYTPYQAEISQGRMEALLNFQTMITDLTGMEIANASLLDESTAAAEAMHMFYSLRSRSQVAAGVNKFFIAADCFPQTIDLLKTRSAPIGIELVTGDVNSFSPDTTFFGMLLQYPGKDGEIRDYSKLVTAAHKHEIKVAVAADLLSLAMLKPPGEWGADCVVGSSQRFGVPMGYGGPHAAFFATHEEFKREIPGRIIGVSVDANGNRALRMALQTREQHIKRDKATSNICTAQVLLAVMASMYAVYHGPKGVKAIARQIHRRALVVAHGVRQFGYHVESPDFFDTVKIRIGNNIDEIRKLALAEKMNFRYTEDGCVVLSMNETTTHQDALDIVSVFAKAAGKEFNTEGIDSDMNSALLNDEHLMSRQSPILVHPVFSTHHSESEMLRYLKRLENKDLSLTHSMIPLGSCTMKLNATSEMVPLSWAAFSNIHPFVPVEQAQGYLQVIKELEHDLCLITGFHAVSLQPNSGAQGEYAGLMVIRNYFLSKGEGHRNVALIPSSAHGTNPASAVMAGMKVVVVKCDHKGNVDIHDLKAQAEKHKNDLAVLMVTYPSTHGVYEESIRDITSIIHEHGGQVYMDGANMNAQVGLTSPGMIGADVCHLNLHKTFAIPHGGGGPGMGPIGVAKHLAPFLPGHPVIQNGGTAGAVSAAPWGSASILLISYGYIRMMGRTGLRRATELAILNANYIMKRLETYYPVLYKGTHGRVAHEMIFDCRSFKQSAGIEVTDIAKRLMDYGFHAPTVSFPVAGTLMVEPTESEPMEELDRFCEAMIAIRKEISAIENGEMPRENNVLVNAPHTVTELTADEWNHPYSRKQAAYPVAYLNENKFWPSVKRVDNAFGDRNLMCTCPDINSYSEELVAAK
ncbi:MAG TPA: aminomethyl-transferring glycine dehydrogenase [Bacteroidia bacterium]|nr:aminomethyl-transferring glycine dehydrogenase [Bacteroidia bacterium]